MKCSIRTGEVLPLLVVVCGMWLAGVARGAPEHARVTQLRCEYLVDPLCIDQAHPRLSWRIDSDLRGVKQTAYRILVASSPTLLAEGQGDLWDSGQVDSDVTNQVAYAGRPLQSRECCYWKVLSWIPAAQAEPLESAVAQWSMGLLDEKDWQAEYISYRDETPVFTDKDSLFLPPARQYRKGFATPGKPVRRAPFMPPRWVSTNSISTVNVSEMTGSHLAGPTITNALTTGPTTSHRRLPQAKTFWAPGWPMAGTADTWVSASSQESARNISGVTRMARRRRSWRNWKSSTKTELAT